MTQAELRRLARIGAEARLEALQREIAAIYLVFPELRRGRLAAAPNPYTAGVRAAVAGAVTRRRRPRLSREARKRIADGQRKRWAEWKAKQGRTVGREGAGVLAAGGSRKKK
jgi:hypothetical protein